MNIQEYVFRKFMMYFGPEISNVYLLREGWHYKIGYSNDVNGRIRELQTGNYRKIEFVDSFSAPKQYCVAFEGAMHRRFDCFRESGEWFCLPMEDVDWLTAQMKAHQKLFVSTGKVILSGREPSLWNVLGDFIGVNTPTTLNSSVPTTQTRQTTPDNTVVRNKTNSLEKRLGDALGGVLEEVS